MLNEELKDSTEEKSHFFPTEYIHQYFVSRICDICNSELL